MPPAGTKYVVLHDFHARVDAKTGREKAFVSGSDYDGPAELIPRLLAGEDFHGPLIAEKPSDTKAATAVKEN